MDPTMADHINQELLPASDFGFDGNYDNIRDDATHPLLLNDHDNTKNGPDMPDTQIRQRLINGDMYENLVCDTNTQLNAMPYHDDESDSECHNAEMNGSVSNSSFHCHGDKEAKPDKLARNQLMVVCALCFLFMVGEAVGGYLSNSLALFTDVLHLGSDLVSFLISLLAIYLSTKPASKKMSFGYHRAEVLGALFSVFIIWLVSGVLCYIAVERIQHEHYKDVKPNEMLITAALGVVFNIVMGIVLQSELCCRSATARRTFGHSHGGHGHSHGGQGHTHRGHNHSQSHSHSQNLLNAEGVPFDDDLEADSSSVEHVEPRRHKNINVRAAFIHVIGDIIQSLGVFTAALIIKCTTEEKYRLADPICTFLFSVLVLITTATVLRDTLRVILEGVPRDLNFQEIKADLESIEGVKMAHGLHLWSLTIDRNAIAVHLAIGPGVDFENVLSLATWRLQEKYNFYHATVQVERYHHDIMSSCTQCQGIR